MSSDSASPKRLVKCPRCQTRALFSPENPYRPFCSERCKMIDLGQWADESFRIPSAPTDLHEDVLTQQSNEYSENSSDEDLN
ncbi:MAG: DNA gyrase inhibitor YacG [Bdellovibrio sp.]|jgi:endogenous inhibitor of DNA gyrase (YacG/DUF329 family)